MEKFATSNYLQMISANLLLFTKLFLGGTSEQEAMAL
jgi:hypothetical protein